MTPHGKAHHVVHCFYSPSRGASVRRRTPVECQSYDNFVAMGNGNTPGCGIAPLMYQTSGPRSAGRRTVQSTVLRGGVRSWANHSQDGGAGQNDLGKKTSLSLFSAVASSSQRAASSLATGLQLASASRAASAPSATPTLSSQASRSLMSTRCTRSTARCSLIECHSESNQRQSRNGWDHRSRKTIYRRNGVVSRRAMPRSVATTSENLDVTGRRDAHLFSSSGDGLGIQQPGSMTWGGFFVPTAPSGRADESAMCPAVARSFSGRAHG